MLDKNIETKFKSLCQRIYKTTNEEVYCFPRNNYIILGDDVVIDGVFVKSDDNGCWICISQNHREWNGIITLDCLSIGICYQILFVLGKACNELNC